MNKNKSQISMTAYPPLLTGQTETGPRDEIFYFSDDGDLTALHYRDWKFIFAQQKSRGTLRVWMEPFVQLRLPMIFNLRRALPTFQEYPPRQKAASFSLDQVMEQLTPPTN